MMRLRNKKIEEEIDLSTLLDQKSTIKRKTYENVSKLFKKGQKVLNGFESKIFPIKNPS